MSLNLKLNPDDNFDHDSINFFISKTLQSQNILSELLLSEVRLWCGEALTMAVSPSKHHLQMLALLDSFCLPYIDQKCLI
jgi:hypothetical protein